MASTSVTTSTTSSTTTGATKSLSWSETIRQIEAQIKLFGNGPHTPKQKEDLNKLNTLLQKAKVEQHKAIVGAKSGEAGQSDVGSTFTPVQSSVPPMRIFPVANTPKTLAGETKVLDKRRLQELVREVDPLEQLDDDVEDVLLQVADDFIDNVVNAACQIAKHRKSNTLEVKDVQLHLERNWNMYIPGFGSEEPRPYKRAAPTEAHKQRMALIRKTMKKF